MNRNTFLRKSLQYTGTLFALPALQFTTADQPNDPIDAKLVREFVSAGHNDLPLVKDMLTEIPNLLNACYDWGHGDFETALEGAGHVGNRDIATYLIAQGARPNIFVLTMLGKTSLVISMLQEFPELLHAQGPHGFTLLHHAKVGGEIAQPLYDYFLENGLTTPKRSIY